MAGEAAYRLQNYPNLGDAVPGSLPVVTSVSDTLTQAVHGISPFMLGFLIGTIAGIAIVTMLAMVVRVK